LKALDVTDLAHPHVVPGAIVRLDDARNVTVSRTYAYVSTGKNGVALVNVVQPEHPRLDQMFTADGQLNDVNDVKIGAVDASVFAYLADGRNGLRILQMISPEDSSESYGFSPRPTPKLIATYRTGGPALSISRGIDRDRAVDESGNQLAVFGRRGARPFDRAEAERLYLRDGKLFTVADTPPGPPKPLAATDSSAKSLYDRVRALLH
jgi:hypothetical protein